MKEYYDHKLIEKTAQTYWESAQIYKVEEYAKNYDGSFKPKFFACSMLPYPSGKLHMGHVRNYTINDMMTRYLRMQGFNVLMPMGWDAFGMPAENAAIKSGISPYEWTRNNISYMKKQMLAMGLAIDWSREICACDPNYYKWNQWLFLKMLEHGIVYRDTQIVNWDPVDKTVLANEQVINGCGWRSGAIVEKREIPGYYLRITNYSEELIDDLNNKLQEWPDQVRIMQEKWMGKSEGLDFAFDHNILDEHGNLFQNGKLHVFTTRPDTLMGVTFCAISYEHPIAKFIARSNIEAKKFIDQCKAGGTKESELAIKERLGIDTGLVATHPITKENIAIWICNYVLMSYANGSIMGVPAHDERDFYFAAKHRINIKQVIAKNGKLFDKTQWNDWYKDTDDAYLVNSGKYNGLDCISATNEISSYITENKIGKNRTMWRLRDWSVSRQRYWGTPIPMINCDTCGTVPVPEKDLPVLLPENLIPDGNGNPLKKDEVFIKCKCPKCGNNAQRETDTMDTFVDSSWYFMRYTSPDNKNYAIDQRFNYWMPIDQYIGGIEHAVLHLLYARFWCKAMRDMGLLNIDEPIKKLLCQGMVLNHTYSRRNNLGGLEYFNSNEIETCQNENTKEIKEYKLIKDGSPVEYNGISTMSKSKNNGVDPQIIIDKFGADTARLFIIFASPPEQTLEWSEYGIEGASRYLKKLWKLCYTNRDMLLVQNKKNDKEDAFSHANENYKLLRFKLYSNLIKANHDYKRMQYNTVVSTSMKILNDIENFILKERLNNNNCYNIALKESIGILLRILYPIVPHITWNLWRHLGYHSLMGDIIEAKWPKIDPNAIIKETTRIVIQINGKLRGSFLAPSNTSEKDIKEIAIKHESISKFINGNIKRIVVVPGKLVNIVI
ncbi:leucyl-tRNA synthetase [Candidatus Kinetoplastibacterium blastocrithidii TCC012E]|uniref:Leucine--tRNA ligase n=1 Tax=Candidatus Kinetoplastidibacterium blastocrithidiae TCC012E TaxID=1208922 RepID=M1MCV8_9PROT|nr:leucine--tRNA ligase [Candidatus Kinetoplastibacterium blastocrithidii]AFZ83903.1 leucyl-tRNA synthetase [Candidatus Kinetoplastibacterium blastocrithidii (ex Strigomonas culicis)]AGF49615.1 leucyl-tRNA synthetase [Candidatus Kinetoplastibacterium blastocrithidii TCC012E]